MRYISYIFLLFLVLLYCYVVLSTVTHPLRVTRFPTEAQCLTLLWFQINSFFLLWQLISSRIFPVLYFRFERLQFFMLFKEISLEFSHPCRPFFFRWKIPLKRTSGVVRYKRRHSMRLSLVSINIYLTQWFMSDSSRVSCLMLWSETPPTSSSKCDIVSCHTLLITLAFTLSDTSRWTWGLIY